MNTNQDTALLFEPSISPSVSVLDDTKRYPVKRIFCVGRNYAEHAKEMGVEVDREAPFYFTKTPSTIVESGATVPYPTGTTNYHYEMEFVVAIGKPAWRIEKERALSVVLGYACGLDMTRRDLQLDARAKGRPWDLGKDFERSAIIGQIVRAEHFAPIGDQKIELNVDGEVKQSAKLSDLVWRVDELISHLSNYYHLDAGDLIYTGTPAGVGAVLPGADLCGTITGLPPVTLKIGDAE
jgi:fumarylpyruvate hydrolase